MSCFEENFKSLPFPLWLKEWFIKMLSWELKYFSLRRFFSAVSQCCGKADFPSLGSPLHLRAQDLFWQWGAVLSPAWTLHSPEPAQQLCPPPELLLLLQHCHALGFSLLTTSHLGLFLLWILILLNMSMSSVCMSLYSVPLISCICSIYIETSPGILIGKIWWAVWKIVRLVQGKHSILVSFLCELVSPLFFIKIYLCYLLCKISCWVKVFKVWCFPPSQSTPDPWEHLEKIPISSFQGKAEEIH